MTLERGDWERIALLIMLVAIVAMVAQGIGSMTRNNSRDLTYYDMGRSDGYDDGLSQCADTHTIFSRDGQHLLMNYNKSERIQLQEKYEMENINNLKADAYAQGMFDGRASILEEQSGRKQKEMGVPEGYISDRTPEWRKYADCIAYDIGCPEKWPDFCIGSFTGEYHPSCME